MKESVRWMIVKILLVVLASVLIIFAIIANILIWFNEPVLTCIFANVISVLSGLYIGFIAGPTILDEFFKRK